MRTKTLVLGGLIAAVFAIAPVAARARPAEFWRPTCEQAHDAADVALAAYAASIDGHLVKGPCDSRGTATKVTRIRIIGATTPERFRIYITGVDHGVNVVIRARRLIATPARPDIEASRSRGN